MKTIQLYSRLILLFSLAVVVCHAQGVGDAVRITSRTLADNPTLEINACQMSTEVAGGSIICEGSVADNFEGLFNFPDVTGADDTQEILTDASTLPAANLTLTGDVSGTANANVVDDVQTATANTEAADNSTTQVATTAFVQQELNGAGGTSLTCSGGTCNVDDDFVSNGGDAIAGNLDFNDGTGDSPAALFTPQTGTAFSFLVEDATDDMRITANTASEENLEFENIGTAILSVFIETSNGVLTDLKDAAHLTEGTINAARVGAAHIDALTEIDGGLCGTNEILEDQGASWACISTPGGAGSDFDLATPATPTISSGSLTLTGSADGYYYHQVATEAAAATDDVTAVTCTAGTLHLISAVDDGDTVVFKASTGFSLDDFSLDAVEDRLLLHCSATDTVVEMHRSGNES